MQQAEQSARRPLEYWPNRAWFVRHMASLLARFEQFHALPWRESNVLHELPGKWQHSLFLLAPDTDAEAAGLLPEQLQGFAINSIRDEALYVHAFFVAPELRGHRLGQAMLATLRIRAHSSGLKGVQLRVDVGNERALKWYLRQGFGLLEDGASGSFHLQISPTPPPRAE